MDIGEALELLGSEKGFIRGLAFHGAEKINGRPSVTQAQMNCSVDRMHWTIFSLAIHHESQWCHAVLHKFELTHGQLRWHEVGGPLFQALDGHAR